MNIRQLLNTNAMYRYSMNTETLDESATRIRRERNLKYAQLEHYLTRLDLREIMSIIAHAQEDDPKDAIEHLKRIKPILPHLNRVLSNMYIDAPELPPKTE